MEGILVCLGRNRNGAFKRKAQTAADGKLAKRYLIIVNLDEGRPSGTRPGRWASQNRRCDPCDSVSWRTGKRD